MKLKLVSIHDFKSVRSSNEFEIGEVTCLVGKNEAGKTALLQARYRLNPVVAAEGNFDVTEDYPRADVEDYRQVVDTKAQEPTDVVHATFELEEKELGPIHAAFGANVLPNRTVQLFKGYTNQLRHVLAVDEPSAVQGLVAIAKLSDKIEIEAKGHKTLKALLEFLNTKAQEQAKASADAITAANTIADQQQKAIALAAASALAETEGSKQLRNLLDEVNKTELGLYVYTKFIQPHIPKFLYFDEYYQMEGVVNLESLKTRLGNPNPSDRPMLGLIDAARLNIDKSDRID